MLRLSRALVILELELLVGARSAISAPRTERERRRLPTGRHGYSSPIYSFDLDILNLCAKGGPAGAWELFIVAEFWRSAQGATVHSPKWLKLVHGKPNDVLRWIKLHRDGATDKSRAPATKT